MINKIVLAIVFFISIQFIVLAQNDGMRKAYELQLAVDEDTYYSIDVKESSYILPNKTIQIYPGEKIYVEATFENNKIASLKYVDTIYNPDKTLEISFEQTTEGKIHQGMRLFIKNPFSKNLGYSALIYLEKYKKWKKTTVFDVMAGLSSYELWPDIISTIALGNFELKEGELEEN